MPDGESGKRLQWLLEDRFAIGDLPNLSGLPFIDLLHPSSAPRTERSNSPIKIGIKQEDDKTYLDHRSPDISLS
jgi:hypothetical protein